MQLHHFLNRVSVTSAIIHCAAIPTGWLHDKTPDEVRAEIDRWHRERGFNGIGYHYLVFPEGQCLQGRALDKVGAHTAGHNVGTLGILMLESRTIDKIRQFHDYFTEAQRRKVAELLLRHDITHVSGHNDHANRLCPGFRVSWSTFFDDPSAVSPYTFPPSTPFQRIGDVLRRLWA